MNYLEQYQQMYNPYRTQPTIPPQNNGINWVQGIEAAKSYMVAPNRSVLLMDSETQSFYIKTTDASGMPMPLRVFDYTERTQTAPQASITPPVEHSEYITREEFERRISEISTPKTVTPKRKEVVIDE